MLASNQSQEQKKTGTDDKGVGDGGESLSKSCFQGAPMRIDAENSGKKTADTIQETALCINNEGAERMFNTVTAFSANMFKNPEFDTVIMRYSVIRSSVVATSLLNLS